MKKFISLLIGCSLALAGAALAQQPEEQPTPKNKQGKGKPHTAQATPGANAAKPEATIAKQHGARNERATAKGQEGEAMPKSAASAGTETNVSGQSAASATPGAKQQAGQRRKGMKTPAANATASSSANPATAASASAAPSVSAAGQQNAQANTGAAAKADPQQVQQIKSQHTNFLRSQSRSGSGGHVQPELSDSRKRSVAGSAIRYSARIIRNGTIRAGIGRITPAWS
jgi:hypothetical protein